MPKDVGVGPKLNALPGTTLDVFRDIALGSMDEFPFSPAYDWKPWSGVLDCCVSAEVVTNKHKKFVLSSKTFYLFLHKIATLFFLNCQLEKKITIINYNKVESTNGFSDFQEI